ncbi:glycosyltransferase family 2 protein [uncultured Thioclava sp.]|mgnify:CR=1 FL=1|uniref:glycosyltransferase family 2 protein n=1 Tax=uncultured Thioclava sp. TaxID=473858 RepID=UPI0025FE8D9C|nr:glycosyltransferase family 2 protein [uncultured Thioclava sp.]
MAASLASTPTPHLGVVIVTYNAADVIADCLRALQAATGVVLHVVVVDNASRDHTNAVVRDTIGPTLLSPAQAGAAGIALIKAGVNGGFAAGVNLGLSRLARAPEIDRFWLLNPDCITPPDTPRTLAMYRQDDPQIGLIAHRVVYADNPEMIQIDGGTIDRRTGITHNINQFADRTAPVPKEAQIEFVTGASLIATRAFYEAAGPMAEEYFLYYEEVDWALRRGPLRIAYCPEAVVLHKAGSAIGSQRMGSVASPFSQYFKHRARAMFLRKNFPPGLIGGMFWSLAKAGQLVLQGHGPEARALLRGYFGLAPPASVLAALSPEARERIGR